MMRPAPQVPMEEDGHLDIVHAFLEAAAGF